MTLADLAAAMRVQVRGQDDLRGPASEPPAQPADRHVPAPGPAVSRSTTAPQLVRPARRWGASRRGWVTHHTVWRNWRAPLVHYSGPAADQDEDEASGQH